MALSSTQVADMRKQAEAHNADLMAKLKPELAKLNAQLEAVEKLAADFFPIGQDEAQRVQNVLLQVVNSARTHDGSCKVAHVSPRDLALLNKLVSEEIKPDPAPQPGRAWEAFPASKLGQCDTQVVTKRAALLALGVDAGAMQIELGDAVYPDGHRVPHMILWVTSDGKRYALDNLTPNQLYTEEKRPYKFERTALQPRDGLVWNAPVGLN